jgi:hypothetical protein
MATIDRHRLYFGPYSTPEFHFGAAATCLVHGEVVISGISDGPIAWPMTTRQGGRSLVLYADLVQAVEREAACAVACWFGVSTWMVRKWRRALGVPARNQGDRLLKQFYAEGENGRIARRAALLTADDPDRRAKISAAQRGRKRLKQTIDSIRATMTGRRLSPEHRAKVIPYLRGHGAQSVAAIESRVELESAALPEFFRAPFVHDSFEGSYETFAAYPMTDGFKSA